MVFSALTSTERAGGENFPHLSMGMGTGRHETHCDSPADFSNFFTVKAEQLNKQQFPQRPQSRSCKLVTWDYSRALDACGEELCNRSWVADKTRINIVLGASVITKDLV